MICCTWKRGRVTGQGSRLRIHGVNMRDDCDEPQRYTGRFLIDEWAGGEKNGEHMIHAILP